MSDLQRLSEVIESIYALALDEGLWPSSLQKINDLIGGELIVWVSYRYDGKVIVDDLRESGVVDGKWDLYAEVSHLDPKVPIMLGLCSFSVVSDYDFITENEMDKHPFYRRLLFPDNLRYLIGAKLAAGPAQHAGLAIQRAPCRGHVQAREKELMAVIARHLSQAATVGRRLHRAGGIEAGLREALDHLPDAVFILGPDAVIIDVNRRAEALLRRRQALLSWRSVLTAGRPTDAKALHDLIAAAALRKPGPGAGRALPIPQDDPCLRPLLAMASPLPRGERPISLGDEAARLLVLLVVSDPNETAPAFPDRLVSLFGLTSAEARLASALAAGASVRDYAERAEISINTARWTLKCVQAKMDCRRQGEVIRILSTLAATAFRPDDEGGS